MQAHWYGEKFTQQDEKDEKRKKSSSQKGS